MAEKNEYKPRTAQVVVGEVTHTDADDRERAREAGVTDVVFVDYAEALENYESREDIETLSERRAREGGADFRTANFRREVGGSTNEGVVTTDTAVTADEDEKAQKAPAKRAAKTEDK
jgi:hypothetical protein